MPRFPSFTGQTSYKLKLRRKRESRDQSLPRVVEPIHDALGKIQRAYSVFTPAPDDFFPLFQVIGILSGPQDRKDSPRNTTVNLKAIIQGLGGPRWAFWQNGGGVDETIYDAFNDEFRKVDRKQSSDPPQDRTVSEESLWKVGVQLPVPAGGSVDVSISHARAATRQIRLQLKFKDVYEGGEGGPQLATLISNHREIVIGLIVKELGRTGDNVLPSNSLDRRLLAIVTTRIVSTVGISNVTQTKVSAGAGASNGTGTIGGTAGFEYGSRSQDDYKDFPGVTGLHFIVFPIECTEDYKLRFGKGVNMCDSEIDESNSDMTRKNDKFYGLKKWVLGEDGQASDSAIMQGSHSVQMGSLSASPEIPSVFSEVANSNDDSDVQASLPYVEVSLTGALVPLVEVDIRPFLNEFAEKQCIRASYYRKTASGDMQKLIHAVDLLRKALRKCRFESTVRALYDLSGCYLLGVGVDLNLGTAKLLRYCASGLRRNYDSRSVWLSRLALEFASYPGPAVERKVISLVLFSRPAPIWIAALAKASIRTPPSPPLDEHQSPARIPKMKSSPPLHRGQSSVVPLKVKSDVAVMSDIALIPQPAPSVPIEPPTKSSPPLNGGQSTVVPLKVKSYVPVILHDSAPADVMTEIERVPCSSVNSDIRGVVKIGVPVVCMALFNDGERAACGGRNGRILIVDLRRHEIKKEWKAHEDWVTAIAVHDDGTRTRIASGSLEGTVKMWLVDTGRCVATFSGHRRFVNSVAVIEDGRKVVSVSDDGTAQVWETNTARVVTPPFKDHKAPVTCVALLGDGEHVVTGGVDNKLRLWCTTTGTQVGDPFVGHEYWVSCVAASPDGRRLVSGSWDRTVRVWDVGTHQQIGNTLEGHKSVVECVSVSKDGGRIISGSCDKTIRVWDSASGAEVCAPLDGHTGWVTGVSFLADADSIVSSSEDGTLRVWDVRSQKTVQEAEEVRHKKKQWQRWD